MIKSVAISNDVILAGSPFHTWRNCCSSQGSVFLFSTATFAASHPVPVMLNPASPTNGHMGYSLAIFEATVVVGVPGDTNIAPGAGGVKMKATKKTKT